MPTLECLDERSRLILERINEMDAKVSEAFRDFRFAIEERNKLIEKRIDVVEADIEAIKIHQAEERGKKTVMIWFMTAVASILGAVGNAVYNWWLSRPQ